MRSASNPSIPVAVGERCGLPAYWCSGGGEGSSVGAYLRRGAATSAYAVHPSGVYPSADEPLRRPYTPYSSVGSRVGFVAGGQLRVLRGARAAAGLAIPDPLAGLYRVALEWSARPACPAHIRRSGEVRHLQSTIGDDDVISVDNTDRAGPVASVGSRSDQVPIVRRRAAVIPYAWKLFLRGRRLSPVCQVRGRCANQNDCHGPSRCGRNGARAGRDHARFAAACASEMVGKHCAGPEPGATCVFQRFGS